MTGKDARLIKHVFQTALDYLENILKIFGISLLALILTGCSTAIAIVDVTASTVIYAGKTVVNTVDAITPNIVNGD